MGEIMDFSSRRKVNEFKEGLKVDANKYNTRDDRVSYIGDRTRIKDPKARTNHRRLKMAGEMYYSLPEEEREYIKQRRLKKSESRMYQRHGKGRIVDVKREHKRYVGSKKKMSKAIALFATGAVALSIFAGVKAVENNMSYNTPTEITQNANELEQLGIDRKTAEELVELQKIVNSGELENYSSEELLGVGQRIEDVQMDVLKTKLAQTLNVNKEDITLVPNYSANPNYPSTATVKVNKDGEETIYDTQDFLNRDTSISGEIEDSILKIGNTQTVNAKIGEGEYDRNGVIEQFRTGVEDASIIAQKQITIDENGNISLAEMDKLIQEKDEEER